MSFELKSQTSVSWLNFYVLHSVIITLYYILVDKAQPYMNGIIVELISRKRTTKKSMTTKQIT